MFFCFSSYLVDTFVFTDAWSQSGVVLGQRCDMVRRLSWTYRRSAKAMAVTSLTTAIAFIFTAISPVMPIAVFGYWASFLVLMQYLFVITMYPCAIVIWHRSLRGRTLKSCFREKDADAYVKGDEITLEDDESEDGSSRLSDVSSDGDDHSKDGKEGKGGKDASETAEAEGSREFKDMLADDRPLWKRCFGVGGKRKKNDGTEYRIIEKFFRYQWVTFVNKLKYPLIVLALALFGGSIFLAQKLQPLSETEEFLPPNDPLHISTRLAREAFLDLNGRASVQTAVFWGVGDVDRASTTKWDPEDIGSPVFDNSFDLKPAAAQEFLLKFCNGIAKKRDLISQQAGQKEPANCWIRDFATWRRDDKSKSSDSFETYRDDKSLVGDLRSFFGHTNGTDGSQPYLRYLRDGRLLFSKDGKRVVYSEFLFETDLKPDIEPGSVVRSFYRKWESAVDELAKGAPTSVEKPRVTFGYSSMWMVTTKVLIRNAFVGLGIMIGVAFVILSLSTGNIIVSLLATVSIGGIVTNLLAMIYLWGFEMGLTESIGVIIAAGVSFDFCSHMANAYVESKSATRHDRVRDALTDLGISVFAGALSTLVSSATLFLASVTFFQKFARFVTVTVALSLIWSLVFLMAILMVIGPEGDFGSLKPLFRLISSPFRRIFPCLRKTKASAEGSASTPTSGVSSDSGDEDRKGLEQVLDLVG